MAINDTKLISHLSDREINWIYIQLEQKYIGHVHELPSLPVKRELIEQHANAGGYDSDEVKELKALSGHYLMPDFHLAWIDANNSRLLYWFKSCYLRLYTQDSIPPQGSTNSYMKI